MAVTKTEVVSAYTELASTVYGRGEGVGDWMFGDIIAREIMPGMRSALDVGCGAGQTVRRLRKKVPMAQGIDITPAMIAQARQQSAGIPGVEFIVGDIQTYEFRRQFDFISALYSLGYVDREKVLQKLFGMLKPGGKLVVIDGLHIDHGIFAQPYGMAFEFPYYVAFRARRGLGPNLRTLARNFDQVGALACHPAWQALERHHADTTYAITPEDYRQLVRRCFPDAAVYCITPTTGFIVATKQ